MVDPQVPRGGAPSRALAIIALAGGLALAAGPAGAQAPGQRWIARGWALGVYPQEDVLRDTSTFTDPLPGERRDFGIAAGGPGFGLGLERRLGERLGVEVAALAGELEGNFRLATGGGVLTDREDIGTEIFTLGANWHLTPGRRADVAVGLFAAMAFFDDVIFLTEAGRREKLAFDDDVGIGVKAGVDIPFGRGGRWALSAEVRFLGLLLEGEIAGQDLSLDPLVPAVGIAYRF